jgi:hypothetical protein
MVRYNFCGMLCNLTQGTRLLKFDSKSLCPNQYMMLVIIIFIHDTQNCDFYNLLWLLVYPRKARSICVNLQQKKNFLFINDISFKYSLLCLESWSQLIFLCASNSDQLAGWKRCKRRSVDAPYHLQLEWQSKCIFHLSVLLCMFTTFIEVF